MALVDISIETADVIHTLPGGLVPDEARDLLPPEPDRIPFAAVAKIPGGRPVAAAFARPLPFLRCLPPDHKTLPPYEVWAATRQADVLAFAVAPEARSGDVGGRLLAAVEAELERQTFFEAGFFYDEFDVDSTAVATAALGHCGGWSEPDRVQLECWLDVATAAAKIPWGKKDRRTRSGLEVIPWVKVTEAERERIRESQAAQPWIPKFLVPFLHEKSLDAATSMALRHEGEIVGWMLTHRRGDTLSLTCTHVRSLEGRAGWLLFMAGRLFNTVPPTGAKQVYILIPVIYDYMRPIILKWLGPWALRMRSLVRRRKTLNPPNRLPPPPPEPGFMAVPESLPAPLIQVDSQP
jgi:GNAT superfamily N-acetyltransferase